MNQLIVADWGVEAQQLVNGCHDEWQVCDRRYLFEASMALLNIPPDDTTEMASPALLSA